VTARGSGEGAQVTMPCSRSRNARHSVRKSGIIITGGKLARECRAKSAPCDAAIPVERACSRDLGR
jgi:hypothetical protein